MTNVLHSRTSVLHEIAFIFEANTDDNNEWDPCEITERIADILLDHGFFTKCDEHGVWPTGQFSECPRCTAEAEEADDEE